MASNGRSKDWKPPLNKLKPRGRVISRRERRKTRARKFLRKCWVSFAIGNTLHAGNKRHIWLLYIAYRQVFVVNLAGIKVSIYWAEFPVQYLETIRNKNVRDLENLPKVALHHTRPQSLLVPEERDRFLRDYVSVVHFIAGGYRHPNS